MQYLGVCLAAVGSRHVRLVWELVLVNLLELFVLRVLCVTRVDVGSIVSACLEQVVTHRSSQLLGRVV